MPSPTPSERSLIARVAAHESWARTLDRSARTAPARRASRERFDDLVDPGRTLPDAVRAERAESARKAYYSRLALRSAQARRRAGESRQAALDAEQVAAAADAELQDAGESVA